MRGCNKTKIRVTVRTTCEKNRNGGIFPLVEQVFQIAAKVLLNDEGLVFINAAFTIFMLDSAAPLLEGL